MENRELKSLHLVMTIQPGERLASLCNRKKVKSLVSVEIWEVMDAISELCMASGIPVCRAVEVFCICYLNMWIAWTSRHINMLHWCSNMTQRLWLYRTHAVQNKRRSLDWRQRQFNNNELVNRNLHEKGTPYATKS